MKVKDLMITLYKLEVGYSLFKLSGISHDDIKKKLFYVFSQG
jgi:hypothetical protein